MSLKFNWKKILLVTANVVVAAYLVMAVTAFNTPADETNKQVCTHVMINIEEGVAQGFLTPVEVKGYLQRQHLYPLAELMTSIDAQKIEETLIAHPLIESAECHKAQAGHLCISLVQRIPAVRIQSDSGEDYYVSTAGIILTPTDYHSNVVVATGNITPDFASKVIAPIAKTIMMDNFWNNQVVQLNVLSDQTIEIVPRVGDNILYLGDAVNIEQKLERLKLFYEYGMTHTGWEKYSRISVEFDNQIICKRKNANKR